MNGYFNGLIYKDGIYSSSRVSSVNYPIAGNKTFYNIEETSFWFKHRNNCILRAINKFQPQGNIFEIGGGNGYVSKAIQDNGFEVVLIEPDHNGIINAKERGVKNLVNCSFEDLEWTEKKIENVALFDVMEHIENDDAFLNDLQDHVKDGALLFLTVPSHNTLYSMEDKHDGHFRRYSLKGLKFLLNKNGFIIEYETCFFTYLILPIYFIKTIPTKLKIGKFKSLEKYIQSQNEQKYKTEHKVKSKLILKILELFHKIELKSIQNLSTLHAGASCLIVARKKNL